MNISEATAKRIVELCNFNNITLNKLCNLSAVPPSTVNEFVNGVTKTTNIVTIKKTV